MTLAIRKRGDQFCLIDVANGREKTLGCHDTRAGAERQQSAVGASSTKPSAWVHQCIRRYRSQGMSEEEAAQRCYGAWHRQHPGRSTRCVSCAKQAPDRAEFYRDIVAEIGKWPVEDATYVSASPFEDTRCGNCEFWQDSACELVDGNLSEAGVCELWMPAQGAQAVSVVRGTDGRRYMFLVTSNGYTDREGEAITVKALADYVKRFNAGRLPQYLDYAHGPVIGQIVAAEMWGPFLVEIAKELPTREAKRRWDFIEATPFLDWACSQQFTASVSDKSRGIFKEINKERSTVIRRSRAANVLTGAGIIIRS